MGAPGGQMTPEAKRALSRTIRGLRTRLIEDLGAAMEGAYKLSIDARKATLSEAARERRARLDAWVDEQVRALPAKSRAGAVERLRGELVKDAAATLLQRLVYLRLLESTGLRKVKVLTGGWESRGYADFREAAPELIRNDETEGFAALLGLVFDELALDLPGLFGPVRMCGLVPVPASTLRAVIEAFDDEELESIWTDDTTLGWIYQYWNDPEREALDAKLAASKKLENHEIASKTQMFTERYMVEWLLHNSLGQMWLAMCRKHGWTADFERADCGPSVLDRLEARRADWRAKREAGEVALDALMPIEPGLEDRWKYWVPQPMPEDAPGFAPDSLRTLKLLDPACGSGHFLVIASELLFHLHKEEARHRGETWTDKEIVESIIENNLFGIDIDPRAVQIAAAALMLKARQLCPDAEPATMNLVAPNLSLASLADNDPARLALYAAVEQETGIPPTLTGKILTALAGADHLGSLLKVDAEIDAAIDAWNAQFSQPAADQGSLFTPAGGFRPRRRKRITADHAKTALLTRLESFLSHHTRGTDLGLRLRGEQLAAGVRFIRMVREGQYDLVVGNPPYLGANRIDDKRYVEEHYHNGKADLYAAFIVRALRLVALGGVAGLVTLRSWMFGNVTIALRSWLLQNCDLRLVADLDKGAFDAMETSQRISVSSFTVRRGEPSPFPCITLRPTAPGEKYWGRDRTDLKRSAVLVQRDRFEWRHALIRAIPGQPILYSWTADELKQYAAFPLLGSIGEVRQGISTGDDTRYFRKPWEIPSQAWVRAEQSWTRQAADLCRFVPLIKGVKKKEGERPLRWIEPLQNVMRWAPAGLQVRVAETSAFRSPHTHFEPGVAFASLGNSFSARRHRYRSVCQNTGTSVFFVDATAVTCFLNGGYASFVAESLNPGLHFEVGDVERLPLRLDPLAADIWKVLAAAFDKHERQREVSVEFHSPAPSAWSSAEEWAQTAVDRPANSPLPAYAAAAVPPAPAAWFSFSVGMVLGRFECDIEARHNRLPIAKPSACLFVSEPSEHDTLADPVARPILDAWAEHGTSIDNTRTLKEYLRERFFPDVHGKMYENRPIYFPLSSAKKSFVAYVSIHRWTANTLKDLLAEHLYPAKKELEGLQPDLRETRDGKDKKAAREAEKKLAQVNKYLEELNEFIANVEMCATKGPPPPDNKTRRREVDAPYEMDLDDGVMINSAALWPLLEPQWKDPKKWWKELANAEGKKDYDWAHLARRYFPARVEEKCKTDPSLAVAHGCFWKYHPAKAYQWELRLQDEIRPEFTIDEVGSDEARAKFLAEHPDEAEALVEKEHKRRLAKKAKAGAADGAQGVLDLGDDGGDDGDEEEGLSA